MVSPGANLDAAISGLNRNLSNAVATASQLSRDGEDLISENSESSAASESSGSDGGLGSIIDVTA